MVEAVMGSEEAADELELPHVRSLEVRIFWGDYPLQVFHLTPPRSFHIGEERADFVIPAEKLGATRVPIVIEQDGALSVVIPPGATATLEVAGEPGTSLGEGERAPLPRGARARIELEPLVFVVADVAACRPARRTITDRRIAGYFALSLIASAALVWAMASRELRDDEMRRERFYWMLEYLHEAADKNVKEQEPEPQAEKQGFIPSRHRAEREVREAFMREPRRLVQDWGITRRQELLEAWELGMNPTELVAAPDLNAPWGRYGAWNDAPEDPPDAWRSGWDHGDNDDCWTKPIGVGTTSVVIDANPRLRAAAEPIESPTGKSTVRLGPISISGRIDPEVVRRIVSRSKARFWICYEQARLHYPRLEGRVGVRFKIGYDGRVTYAANGGGDLPSICAVACVVDASSRMSFPMPEAGSVEVTLAVDFSIK